MFTVCPKCALTLAVTAADLRAGQGYVRCGRCANVFNALLGLSEESSGGSLQAAPPPAPARPAAPPRAAAPVNAPANEAAPAAAALAPSAAAAAALTAAASTAPSSAPTTAMAAAAGDEATRTETAAPGAPAIGDTAAPATTPATTPAPAPTQAPTPVPGSPPALRLIESPPRPPESASSTQVEEFRGTGTFETIVLEGDTFLQTEELVPEEAFDDEIAAVSRRIAAAHDEPREPQEQDEEIIDFSDFTLPRGASPANDAVAQSEPLPFVARENAGRHAGGARAASPAAAEPPDTDASVDEVIQDLEPERAFAGWKVIAGLALAALLLLVQGIDHWRNDLATRPAFEGPLTRLYGAMHRSLTPNWNLAAYEVRQLGASSDAMDSHNVRVRLSLSNHAAVPQAVPLLRITLLDRYGKSLSAGELTPSQYLPAALRSRSLLDAEQRVDTEVSIPDPTQQASSFELDVCIPASGNSLRCAADGAVLGGSGASS